MLYPLSRLWSPTPLFGILKVTSIYHGDLTWLEAEGEMEKREPGSFLLPSSHSISEEIDSLVFKPIWEVEVSVTYGRNPPMTTFC